MKKLRNIVYLVAILFFLGIALPLVDARVEAGNLTSEADQLIREAPSISNYGDTGAVVLLKEGRMTAGKNAVHRTTIHVVGKILDEKAASDYGEISRYFNSYYDDATLDFARTLKKDGKVIEVSKDATQVKTPPGVRTYTDLRLLTFSLPALEVESVFEYQVTIKNRLPRIENRWYQGFRFNHLLFGISRIDPVYKSRFILKVPERKKFAYRVNNTEASPTIKKEGGFVTYTWEVENLPAIPIEGNMPPVAEMHPIVWVSSLKGWKEVDEWATGLFSPKIAVTREVKAKAKHITREAKTEKEKIQDIFYYIQSTIEYVAADLLRGGQRPHPANEILKNQYGDCKDQVVLFLSMLKAIGIRGYPAFINPYPIAEVNREVPLPNFSHVIVYIPSKGRDDLWLDTTSGVTEFPYLHWTDQDRWAFVINGKGGNFLKTPSSKLGDNQGIIRIHSKFKDETLNCKMTVEGKGAMSDHMKSIMKSLPAFQQEQIISGLVKTIDPNAQVRAIDFSDLDNPRLPFNATAHFELEFIGMEPMTSFSYSSNALPMLSFFTELNNLPSPENRKNDYVVSPFKFKLVQEWFCSPPTKDFGVSIMPREELLDTDLVLFRTKYPEEGKSLRARSEFVSKQNRIRKEKYRAFCQSIQETLKKSQWQLVFKRSMIDRKGEELEAKVGKRPQDAIALLNLAKHHLTRGKYKEAKELLEKAVIIAPENGEIHYFLGLALGYLDQYDEGKKKFEKAKELGYEP